METVCKMNKKENFENITVLLFCSGTGIGVIAFFYVLYQEFGEIAIVAGVATVCISAVVSLMIGMHTMWGYKK